MALKIAAALADILFWLSFAGMCLVGIGFLFIPALYFMQRSKRTDQKPDKPVIVLSDGLLPPVLVQLPVFNEPEIIEGLLRSVAALDWPRDRLRIQLLDDSTDQTSEIAAAVISALRLQRIQIDHLRRGSRDGYKAGALSAGLSVSDEPYVAILDADFRPPANWLKAALPCLLTDLKAGFVQSRCEFVNAGSNWLTRAQALLFDAHFVMEQASRAKAGLVFQFNGTAGIWRRAAIESAGGWSGDTLSEDLDLMLRAALAGWHGVFAMEPPVSGLMPDRLGNWAGQQRRWAAGFAQTARKLAGPVWKSRWPLKKKIAAEFLIFYQIFLSLTLLAFAASVVKTALNGGDFHWLLPVTGFTCAFIVVVAVGMTLPPYMALERGGFLRYLAALGTIPLLFIFLSLKNGAAIIEAFFGRHGVFHRTQKWHHFGPIA
jgi:cellulose synthase/poly-beta-1,6-N-acetylglucosamine synthase-like glycosyltransferase